MMDNPEWFAAQKEGMEEDDAQRWAEAEYKGKYRSHVPRVFDKLSDYAVPMSLVHGDLNPMNALVSENDELEYRFCVQLCAVPLSGCSKFCSRLRGDEGGSGVLCEDVG